MRQTRILMGMPVTLEVVDASVTSSVLDEVYDYLHIIDRRYSPYQEDSEISRINHGLPEAQWSDEMKQVLQLCEQTKQETNGYFDINHNGIIDPSGLVKGWALYQAAKRLLTKGFTSFYLEGGGDIQVNGQNPQGEPWRIGIRNPFNREETIKTVALTTEGIATSGTDVRGQHVYNPHAPQEEMLDVASLTVVGPTIYEADRFATAAFAMGSKGLTFIESLKGFEGYQVGKDKLATLTSGFARYVIAA